MAICVIDFFEMMNFYCNEADGEVMALRFSDLSWDGIQQEVPVIERGKLIGYRYPLQLLALLLNLIEKFLGCDQIVDATHQLLRYKGLCDEIIGA